MPGRQGGESRRVLVRRLRRWPAHARNVACRRASGDGPVCRLSLQHVEDASHRPWPRRPGL